MRASAVTLLPLPVLRRLALTAVSLLLVSAMVFILTEVLPGNPGTTILGPLASPEQIEQVNRELGADRPLVVRYVAWLGGFVVGDWGTSYLSDEDVRSVVLDAFLNSLVLALFIVAIVLPLALVAGSVAAVYADRATDRVLSTISIVLIAIPEFVMGVLLLLLFAVHFSLFPASASAPQFGDPIATLRSLFLPALTGACLLFAYLMRMVRTQMIGALNSNYARSAALKGAGRRRIVWQHALPNSLVSTITVLGAQLGGIVGSLVIVETLFGYPGIGKLILSSATGHDLPVLEAAVLLVAVVYFSSNLLADIIQTLLDPRLRRPRDRRVAA